MVLVRGVSTMARTGRSRKGEVGQRRRSARRGNASPASTTIRSSPSSKTVMFFPDLAQAPERDDAQRRSHCLSLRSPRDDQAATRGASSLSRSRESRISAVSAFVGLDERQAQPAYLVAEQLERLLDRDRVRLHQDLERGPKLLVEGLRAVDVGLVATRSSPSPAGRRRACGHRCPRRRRPRGTRNRSSSPAYRSSPHATTCAPRRCSASPASRLGGSRSRRAGRSSCSASTTTRRDVVEDDRPVGHGGDRRRARRCRAAAACCSKA